VRTFAEQAHRQMFPGSVPSSRAALVDRPLPWAALVLASHAVHEDHERQLVRRLPARLVEIEPQRLPAGGLLVDDVGPHARPLHPGQTQHALVAPQIRLPRLRGRRAHPQHERPEYDAHVLHPTASI
jgi:hypothetical protein